MARECCSPFLEAALVVESWIGLGPTSPGIASGRDSKPSCETVLLKTRRTGRRGGLSVLQPVAKMTIRPNWIKLGQQK